MEADMTATKSGAAETFGFGEGALRISVTAQGAELTSIQDAAGHELLWQAGPEWPRHSPVLFPIVGRLHGDGYAHAGQHYKLGQHGFARDRRFAWTAQSPTGCSLTLEADEESRAIYPFPFRLEIAYAVEDGRLTVRYRLTNTGDAIMPAALGAHPGFAWPILPGIPKEAHEVRFARDEAAPVHRVANGLLTPEAVSPVVDRVLRLEPDLFEADALVFTRLASRSLRYSGRGTPVLEIAWEGFEQLGIWSKPGGAPFLCIEPWHGFADPAGFTGSLAEKPGMMLIPPGTVREMMWSLRVLPAEEEAV
jgi:galactose mutarotase-like enzyme